MQPLLQWKINKY